MVLKIQKAQIKDIGIVMSLNKKLFDYEISNNFDTTLNERWAEKNKNYFKERVIRANHLTLIAIVEGKTVGYLIGGVGKPENYRTLKRIAELENMIVLPEHRGQKIGEALVKEFLRWVKTKKVKRIKVVATARNKRAIEFYKKLGFFEHNLTLEQDLS